MVLTRDTALVDNPVLLESRFYDGEDLTDVHSISRVEIWKGPPDLDSSTLVQTIYEDSGIFHSPTEDIITSTGITHTSTGVIQYTVDSRALDEKARYYDEVYFTPAEDAEEESVLGQFDANILGGVSSLGYQTCKLTGTITDATGEPVTGVQIKVNKHGFAEAQQDPLIVFRPQVRVTDAAGYFFIYVRTGIKLVASIPAIGYRRIFNIAPGTKQRDLKEIDSWLFPPVDNPGESNNYLGTSTGLRPSSTGYTSSFSHEINMPEFDWDDTE